MMETNEILNILNRNYDKSITNIEFYREAGSIAYVVLSQTEKFFLRIIRPNLLETALQSIRIHLYLRDKSFPVPAIIYTKESQPYVNVSIEGNSHLFVLYEYIEGGEPDSEDAEKVGELIGQFHAVMKNYPYELQVQDKYYFIDRYIDILSGKNHKKTEEYRALGNKLWEKVKNLPRGYCHCDLYQGNILKALDGRMYVLDFDTSCYAFPMYDITLYCNETDYFAYSDDGFENSKKRLERFLIGYLKYCELTEEENNAFYYFHAIYHFQLQAVIVNIFGPYCNEEDFEDKQLDWIISWLKRAKNEIDHDVL